MCLFCLFCIKGAVASREHQVPSKPCFVNKLDYTQMARMYFSRSTGARIVSRIFLHSCLDPDAAPDEDRQNRQNRQASGKVI